MRYANNQTCMRGNNRLKQYPFKQEHLKMDQFFISQDPPVQSQQYEPPQQPYSAFDFVEANNVEPSNATSSTLAFNNYESSRFEGVEAEGNEGGENDFNDFEQDEITRRIRADEQRTQRILKQKSQKEWQQKSKRKQQGRRQLEQFQTKSFQNKQVRAQENLRKEEIVRQENGKLNVEAGWKKVIMNINMRQGEHKGTKDVNRMREAILHIRQDKGK